MYHLPLPVGKEVSHSHFEILTQDKSKTLISADPSIANIVTHILYFCVAEVESVESR